MKNQMSRLLPVLAALLMMVFFAACEKDEITNTDTTVITPAVTTTITSPVASRVATSRTQAQSSTATGFEIECISVDYPFDFDVDGVFYTMSDFSDVQNLVTSVITPNTVSVDFVYPLNVTLDDGSASVAADAAALSSLVSACVPGWGWGIGVFPAFFFDDPNCVTLSYPVTLADSVGNTVTVADATAYVDFLAATPGYQFVFPLSVVDAAGNTFDVSSTEDLFNVIAECATDQAELSFYLGEGCFTYDYPVTITDTNGGTQSIADDNELSAAILNGNFEDFQYGFSVTLDADGSQMTIANNFDFIVLVQNCNGGNVIALVDAVDFITQSLSNSCYEMVYPFDVSDSGTITTINNETEALSFLNGGEGIIVFPVDVISAGQQVTLATGNEYVVLVGDCNNTGVSVVPASVFLSVGVGPTPCYGLIYPVTIQNPDLSTFMLTTEAEVVTYLQGSPDGSVQLPVDVIDASSGATITLADALELFTLISNCQ